MTSRSPSPATTPWAGILTLIFVVLKLTDQIDWSWWWVLSPLWITLLITLAVMLMAAPFAARKVSRGRGRRP